jgi:hypothetical protein
MKGEILWKEWIKWSSSLTLLYLFYSIMKFRNESDLRYLFHFRFLTLLFKLGSTTLVDLELSFLAEVEKFLDLINIQIMS